MSCEVVKALQKDPILLGGQEIVLLRPVGVPARFAAAPNQGPPACVSQHVGVGMVGGDPWLLTGPK
jgi:hypothetical protein